MRERLRFIETYREDLTLADGQLIRLRLLCPSDKACMISAFAELSAQSRHKRFFSAKDSLSHDELRYFTEMDGYDHFALAAVEIDTNGNEGRGLGVTRCIRLVDDIECAEVAITVIDRMQGHGIGRILLERLVDAARERGIARFRFECLAHNQEIQGLIGKVCRIVDTHCDGEVRIVETDLPNAVAGTPQHAPETLFNLYNLLQALAIQSIDLQMDMSRATLNQTIGVTQQSVGFMSTLKGTLPFQLEK
ncbi:MAG: GNAT family N-acetyltransferase [Candidatus Thiodiazotropha sp. (ex Monitilora ramsayi)]|nr:GNAT family N-acetyltransferase [Candidatus Thiodiazotropha sp. (ex Monitilora ramsayi)]